MKEIVENNRSRRLWITTNLFMLCLIHQLILATPTSQDSAVTLNNTQSEQINVSTLSKEMDILKSKLSTVKNLTENDGGRFHKGSSRNMSNITQIERNILQIQNTVQELSKITDNGISDLGSLKERMITLEMEVEDLRRLYDNDGRGFRQDVGNFDSLLANLTQAHKLRTDQMLTRINDLEKTLKYLQIPPEFADFYKVMDAKNFSEAAVIFNKIISKNDIVKFIKESYKIVNNFDCYMKLAEQFISCDIPQKIYSGKENNLWQENESYADICRYAIILHSFLNIKAKSKQQPKEDLTILDCNKENWFDILNISRPFVDYLKQRIWSIYYEVRTVIDGIKLDLDPLLQTNRHSAVGLIAIRKPYLNGTVYILDNFDNLQTLYCENNVVRLNKDNYMAPIDNC